MNRVTRRRFLQKAALAAAALPASLGTRPAMHRLARGPLAEEGFPLVSVARGTNNDSPEAMLKTALEGLGGLDRFVKPGQVVAIKPNATWAYKPHTASSTDPDFLKALIQMVRQAGAKKVVVVDHVSIDPGTAESLRVSGLGKIVDEMGVEKVFPDRFNATRDVYTRVEIAKGKDFKQVGVIKAAVEADVRINLAVAKTHSVTKMTMCLKHMMGFLEVPQNLHTSLEQGIADINQPSPIQAQLHILEAIRVRMPYPNGQRVCAGPETDLTYPNIVKRMNMIVAGVDPVLIDAFGCIQFFDYRPEELTHVLRAFESGVGKMDVGEAMIDGRLRIFQVGKPIITATPTSTPTSSPTQSRGTPQPTITHPVETGTPTPLPTATPIPIQQAIEPVSPAPGSGGVDSTIDVINPNSFLNGALIPAAIVILGAGMAVAKHLGAMEKAEGDGASEA